MIFPENVWSTLTSTGQALGERVSRKPPTILAMEQGNINAFIEIWNQRLKDAVTAKNQEVEIRARLLLKFVTKNQQPDLSLLLWGEFNLSALYDKNGERFVLIE